MTCYCHTRSFSRLTIPDPTFTSAYEKPKLRRTINSRLSVTLRDPRPGLRAIHACIGYSYFALKVLLSASGEKAPNPSDAGIIASEAGNAAVEGFLASGVQRLRTVPNTNVNRSNTKANNPSRGTFLFTENCAGKETSQSCSVGNATFIVIWFVLGLEQKLWTAEPEGEDLSEHERQNQRRFRSEVFSVGHSEHPYPLHVTKTSDPLKFLPDTGYSSAYGFHMGTLWTMMSSKTKWLSTSYANYWILTDSASQSPEGSILCLT